MEVFDYSELFELMGFSLDCILICLYFADFHKTSSRWSEKDSQISNLVSSDDEFVSKSRSERCSPRTVLEACERESQGTEEDVSSYEESVTTKSPVDSEPRGSLSRKPMSPFKRISSFLFSSFDLSARKRNDTFYNKEKNQPAFKCFNYQQIANATNNFHPGKNCDIVLSL